MTAREVIAILKADGWYEMKGNKSGHRQFKNDQKPGKVTVPMHPGDLTIIVIKGIEKQSGLKIKR